MKSLIKIHVYNKKWNSSKWRGKYFLWNHLKKEVKSCGVAQFIENFSVHIQYAHIDRWI